MFTLSTWFCKERRGGNGRDTRTVESALSFKKQQPSRHEKVRKEEAGREGEMAKRVPGS
jgi:hypothetical protein